MMRTEKHIIKKNNKNYKQIDNLCFLSKNLYNYANFMIRQEFIFNQMWLRYNLLEDSLRKNRQDDYFALSPNSSQQILMILDKNWKSFFKAIKDWKSNSNKYLGRPKMPKYKKKTKGRNLVVFTINQVKLKKGYIHFPQKSELKPIKTKICGKLKQVRLIPQSTCFKIEVVYEEEEKQHIELDKSLYLFIDLGLNNLATLTSNKKDFNPILINGKIIKSINVYFNKLKAKAMKYVGDRGISNRISRLTFKRNCKVDNYIHHVSKSIVNICIEYKIGNIIIGYNPGWKQKVNIGKRNNQNFVNIPMLKLLNQIEYKSQDYGINVIRNEESYTSKTSALDLEKICKHQKYLGRRKKRGLFETSEKIQINADVNGSLNIGRKVIGNAFIKLLNIGCVQQPVKHTPLNTRLYKGNNKKIA